MKLNGLVAATYTPFRSDGVIDYGIIPGMVDHMIERGVSGFYVCGSTGEGESLTPGERIEVARAFTTATRKRVPVVIQVGHNSLETAKELARHAAEIDADAISTLPPTYFKPASLELLLDFIAEVMSSAPDLPYYYYHIPRLSGVAYDTVSLLEQASQRLPRFAGIKFSDFFLAEMMACQEFEDGRYDIVFGSDEMLLGALATGATGAVGSCYGFAAPLWLEIIRSFGEGDLSEARAWMRKAARLVRILDREPGPFQACVKQVVWPLLGFEVGPCRLPQARLSSEAVERARIRLEDTGFAEEIRTGNFQLP